MTLPVGTIIAYHWDLQASGVNPTEKEAELKAQGWESCDGSRVDTPGSPIHGHKKPNLNQYRLPLGTPFETGIMNPSSDKPNEAQHRDGQVKVQIASEVLSKTTGFDGNERLFQDPRVVVYSAETWKTGAPITSKGLLNFTIDATPPITTVWYLIKVLP